MPRKSGWFIGASVISLVTLAGWLDSVSSKDASVAVEDAAGTLVPAKHTKSLDPIMPVSGSASAAGSGTVGKAADATSSAASVNPGSGQQGRKQDSEQNR